jgi:hypothetical protein
MESLQNRLSPVQLRQQRPVEFSQSGVNNKTAEP